MSYNVTGKAVHDIELGVQQYGYDSFTKVILMKQNDINSHVIHAKIKDNNESLLTGEANKTIKFIAKLPNNAPCFINGSLDDGDVYIEVAPSILEYAGKVECEVQVITEAETITASHNRSLVNVTVNEESFKTKVDNATGKYIFNYDGTNWDKNPADYGITTDNKAVNGDEITVYYTTESYWKSETFYISVVETVNEFSDVYYCKQVDCIQLGAGLNDKEKTLQVYGDNIYDANNGRHCLTVQNIELSNEFKFVGEDEIPKTIITNNSAVFAGLINVGGTAEITGATTLKDTLVVNGISTFNDDITADKDLKVIGNADIGGYVKVGGITEITGKTTLKNSLEVAGVSTFKNNVAITENLSLDKNATITGTLKVSDITELTKRLTALADIVVGDITSTNLQITNTGISAKSNEANSGLYLNDNGGVIGLANGANGLLLTPDASLEPSANDNLTLGTSSKKFKKLFLSGDANIGGSLTLGGNATITGTTTLNNTVNINGATTITGNLTIKGNISQEGTTYETHAEQVYSTKDYIYLREGNTGALTDGSYSGLQFVKYDGTNDGRLVVDKNGVARVGDVGDEQPIATREETPNANGVAYWDSTNKRFTTSSKVYVSSDKLFSNSSEVVNLADAQTIGGAKVFTSNVNVGAISGVHIEISGSNITAKSNTSTSGLYLNNAGGVIGLANGANGLLLTPGSELAPSTTNTLNLGTDAKRFKDLYLTGNAYFATPDADSDTTVGATTEWVRDFLESQHMGEEELAKKVNIAQGTDKANHIMVTDENGNVTPSTTIKLEGCDITSGVDDDGYGWIEFTFPDDEETA